MAEEEIDDIIIEEAFSVSTPAPNNKRLISISGLIPSCDAPAYSLFENFLWTLIDLDKEKIAPIIIFINSCGGDADSFFNFYDFIAMLKSPIYTVTNKAESAGALMFILGAKGHRYIFPSAHLIIHSCRMFCRGFEEEKKQKCKTGEEDKLLNLYNQRLANIVEKRTGGKILKLLPLGAQTKREILSLLKDDLVLTADEAIKYGLADRLVTPDIFTKFLQ